MSNWFKIRMMDKLALEKESFDATLEGFVSEVTKAKSLSNYDQRESAVEFVNVLKESILEAKLRAQNFNEREKVFGFPPTEYTILTTVESELEPFYRLWNMISDFYTSRNEWLHGPFLELNGNEIEKEVTEWWKSSYRYVRRL